MGVFAYSGCFAAIACPRSPACGRAVKIEAEASHLAMDVIFRTMVSVPIKNEIAVRLLLLFAPIVPLSFTQDA